MASELVLQATDLSVAYGRAGAKKGALSQATFRLYAGEAVGVIGETGAGKSSLARAVLGLVEPSGGTIDLCGERVTDFGARQWASFRKRGLLQYVFQDPLRSLDPDLTVEEAVAEPLAVQGTHSAAQITTRVREELRRVRLDLALLSRLPGELSGGQRQRVAIARALISGPRLLILDEPVSALDSENRRHVLTLLLGLRASGTSLLFISHDLGSVAGICDRVIVLHNGAIVESDATDAIVNRPQHPYTQKLLRSAPTLAHSAAATRSDAPVRRASV